MQSPQFARSHVNFSTAVAIDGRTLIENEAWLASASNEILLGSRNFKG